MVTHDMNIVAKYAHRVVVLHQGEIVLEGSPREVFEKVDIIEKLALIPPQITLISHRLKDIFQGKITLTIEEALSSLLS